MWDIETINQLNDLAAEGQGQEREALRHILAPGGRPRYYLPVGCTEPKRDEREDQATA